MARFQCACLLNTVAVAGAVAVAVAWAVAVAYAVEAREMTEKTL